MNIQNILAATDLSPQAGHAVERAAGLAAARGARLHLLHVMPEGWWKLLSNAGAGPFPGSEEALGEAALAELQAAADALGAAHGIEVQASVASGKAHVELARYALANSIDLTVMGAHAQHFVRDLFIGATTLKFLRTGCHPVMIARSERSAAPRTVLVPVDFSDISRNALETALAFAPDASICVLHVYDVLFEGMMRHAGVGSEAMRHYRQAAHDEAGRALTQFLAGFPASVTGTLRHGSVAPAIVDEAAIRQADLVVMGKRGGVEIDKMLLGSVTENVLFDLHRDLLLVGEA